MRDGRQPRVSAAATLAWLLAAALACAAEPGALEEQLAAHFGAGSREEGDLEVRLAFGAEGDLDLYVTDPLEESIYFARRETRSGGRLDPDRTCSDPAPRVERAVYPDAPAGHYRVGVDYHAACSDSAGAVTFVLQVDYRGRREVRRLRIEPGQQLIEAYAFEIAP